MKKKCRSKRQRFYHSSCVILFLLPSFLLLAVFVFWPMIYSMVLAFFEWNPLKGKEFTGLLNFRTLMQDDLWWTSLKNTIYYIILNVPLIVAAALGLAEIVVSLGRTSKLFRGIYFIPTMLSLVATGIVWSYLLNTNTGVINGLLNQIGLPSVKWFTSGKVAMLSIVIVTIWRWAGYYMVMFVAGMLGISEQYYEAADLEGAGRFQKFRYITLPQLKPMIYFVALMSIIGSFQEFDLFYMITLGGPGTATYVTGFYMWQTAFSSMKMGYASAMSVVLFVIVLLFTVIQNKVTQAD
ncbi:sugar ABC transporter permease [Diplocloster hominis]|uniref:carbohydrate ABC transporter permease n=1 Tax=Diplocloster hominis TaxID=3079010 RepID=UPI0031B9F487